MKQEIKDLWVKALRSGEYVQGRQRLRNLKDECCCLGVLCDLYLLETGKNSWEREGDNSWGFGAAKHVAYTPGGVLGWAGLSPQAEDDLVTLNDSKKQSFEQIAYYIEKHL